VGAAQPAGGPIKTKKGQLKKTPVREARGGTIGYNPMRAHKGGKIAEGPKSWEGLSLGSAKL